MESILIIDDDSGLCALLKESLRCEGFVVEAVSDGRRGLERALAGESSLVVLDLMLPGLGGLEVLKRLRPQSRIPVLILTARGEDVERILGLELGADDYLAKPFNPRELVARIRAILRRVQPIDASACQRRTSAGLPVRPFRRLHRGPGLHFLSGPDAPCGTRR